LVEEAAPDPWPATLEREVTGRAGDWFTSMLERRAGGEPLQYVLGHWAFRGLDLMVDRRVLIPRPETEVVVDVALGEIDRLAPPDPVAVDLGTGSGAIALALASERPGLAVWATDESADALEVAGANLAGLGGWAATRVRLAEGSWWDALPGDLAGRIGLAVSNPPYVAAAEVAQLDPVITDWEPRRALVAGPGGLEAVAQVLAGARRWLTPGAAVVVEVAPHQADAALALAAAAGLEDGRVHPDLAGRPRAVVGRAPLGHP